MSTEVAVAIVGVISAGLTGLFTYLTKRSEKSFDVKLQERNLIREDLTGRISTLESQNKEFKAKLRRVVKIAMACPHSECPTKSKIIEEFTDEE